MAYFVLFQRQCGKPHYPRLTLGEVSRKELSKGRPKEWGKNLWKQQTCGQLLVLQ